MGIMRGILYAGVVAKRRKITIRIRNEKYLLTFCNMGIMRGCGVQEEKKNNNKDKK